MLFRKTLIMLYLALVGLGAWSQEGNLFDLALEQDDLVLTPEEGVYSLEPQEFVILATIQGNESLYLNFSTNPALYNAVRDGKNFQKVLGFGGTGMAEALGNPDQEIWLTDGGWHVWFAQNSKVSRFDEVLLTDWGKVGIRTVKSLYDVDAGERIAWEEVEQIYLVLADARWAEGEYEVKAAQGLVLDFR
jgi:hypothetical protein